MGGRDVKHTKCNITSESQATFGLFLALKYIFYRHITDIWLCHCKIFYEKQNQKQKSEMCSYYAYFASLVPRIYGVFLLITVTQDSIYFPINISYAKKT